MKGSQMAESLLARMIRAGLVGLAGVAAVAGSATGCLDRPVSPASPNTTNVFVQDIKQQTVDKIDMLFMIDNSISMADKQQILGEAVPPLLNRLITPQCEDDQGNLTPPVGTPPACPTGTKQEFKPVVDIHIGVITSSLGGHGGSQCSKDNPSFNATEYDNAHLIPSVRPASGLSSYQNMGFLWWDPTSKKADPPGEGNEGTLIANFTAHVKATGETGCGFEASLEAWYRFLVDPNPPENVTNDGAVAVIQGPDSVLLQQRKDFLRQDSLVAIVMLTDENDCSTVDGGVNWIASHIANGVNPFYLPRATAACGSDPNNVCCRSCASSESSPPPGCGTIEADPECQKGKSWDDVGDAPNLRCWDQKRRFGIDFLYPTRRYVEGLSQPRICPQWDANGPVGCDINNRVPNPLFNNSPDGAGTSRDANLIYIAAIVGVPWQDIATDESLTGPGLKYLTATELTAKGRWDWMTPKCLQKVTDELPRPMANMCARWDLMDKPDDALMIESSLPRTGTALGVNQPLADPGAGAMANPVNGHEWNTGDADLQYACIFQRATPLNCDPAQTGGAPGGCDCDNFSSVPAPNNPLCQGGGGYSFSQVYAKAFPGVRHLQVLRDFGTNSIVSSICPKLSTGASTDPSYGYNPAVAAIIDRLKEVLAGQCVNRPIDLPKDANGNPDPTLAEQACAIVEVTHNAGQGCGCDGGANRKDVDPKLVTPVLQRLKDTAQCGTGLPPCDAATWCMCEIGLSTDINACLNDPNATATGWCYIDATTPCADDPTKLCPIGNPALVEGCEPKRQIRFVGQNTPQSGSTVFIACLGAPLTQTL